MKNEKVKNSENAARELIIERELDAPVELVWEVWSSPEHIKNWWGPNGFSLTIHQMDFVPGGAWDFIMHGPDGTDFKNKNVYKEIVKNEKIVYEHVSAPKFRATITFAAAGKKTRLTWKMLFETADQLDQVVKVFKADEGLKQNVEKLNHYLANKKALSR